MTGVVFQNVNCCGVGIVVRHQCLRMFAMPGAESATVKAAYRETQQEVWYKDGGKQGMGKIFIFHRKGMLISISL